MTNLRDDSNESKETKGTMLDPWINNYAERANNLRSSEIRALFSVVSRPEVVSLAGGMPNLKDLPIERLAESAKKLILENGAVAMQYGQGQGYKRLREQILNVMAYENIKCDPDDIVVATGSQQILDLITSIFINPGDVVLVESPSYVGALGGFRSYQADIQHVLMDQDGIIPEALEEKIIEVKKSGKTIKFLYTIPNFHNPAGVTLSVKRRPQIVDICNKHHILIVEDNPYGLLGFNNETFPALHSYAPESVVYLGSFSKIFAPGFRVGWAVAPHAIRNKLILAAESAILSPSMVGQMGISGYLEEYDWYGQIEKFRSMYKERRDAMLQALADYMPNCTWTVPKGGFYTWVKVPEGINTKEMLPRAVTELVAYVPGTAFYADGQGTSYMRLAYCYPTPEFIREGVRRLSVVLNREVELVELFGSKE
ncbi:PLP-dependent aminotransferase family protein [Actinomyces sp. zg-332]|uniref:aminotransferase-like domain-containing protein n=1 Tax=Actinomyces sp. zg-332 TaxID=2708340 RepID=UPI00142214BC|nr:PLP-dependent aminotransferase family protein [Actinomyces sp. zg-332]QPK94138.1 PLP-dependent aminotransferase family protein [Actinomyces sp. zg-332]